MNPSKLQNDLANQKGFNLKTYSIIVAILLIVSYGIFTARDMIRGPSIDIINPTVSDTETTENLIIVRGLVHNTVFLSLNERKISIDTKGFFEEKILLTPGFNVIEIKGRDRFKKEVVRSIRVYYKQQ